MDKDNKNNDDGLTEEQCEIQEELIRMNKEARESGKRFGLKENPKIKFMNLK